MISLHFGQRETLCCRGYYSKDRNNQRIILIEIFIKSLFAITKINKIYFSLIIKTKY